MSGLPFFHYTSRGHCYLHFYVINLRWAPDPDVAR
jgi:hypothetical protein